DHGNSNGSHVKIFLPKKLLECLPKCSSLPKERHRWNTNEARSADESLASANETLLTLKAEFGVESVQFAFERSRTGVTVSALLLLHVELQLLVFVASGSADMAVDRKNRSREQSAGRRQQAGAVNVLVRRWAWRVCRALNSSRLPSRGQMHLLLVKSHLCANFVLPEKLGRVLRLVLGAAAPMARTRSGAAMSTSPSLTFEEFL
ncbi:PREDICTED: uncharacterized protein LOC104483711, partial [Chlamydotis macqueenii]|uniref:uncharacterized protein LOC104483711 n=1 Tax=Chlamydotis macqueenii TaxID=187382 RepID=UPI0005299918